MLVIFSNERSEAGAIAIGSIFGPKAISEAFGRQCLLLDVSGFRHREIFKIGSFDSQMLKNLKKDLRTQEVYTAWERQNADKQHLTLATSFVL